MRSFFRKIRYLASTIRDVASMIRYLNSTICYVASTIRYVASTIRYVTKVGAKIVDRDCKNLPSFCQFSTSPRDLFGFCFWF